MEENQKLYFAVNLALPIYQSLPNVHNLNALGHIHPQNLVHPKWSGVSLSVKYQCEMYQWGTLACI